MTPESPLLRLALGERVETLLPDLVLGFTFFTALTYVVLSRRFDRQRPAAAMSATIGLALSVGLVAWEQERGWSIQDLGPIAIGLTVVGLGAVVYPAARKAGGIGAGAGIALGTSLLVAWLFGLGQVVAGEVLFSIVLVALVFGGAGLILHHRRSGMDRFLLPVTPPTELSDLQREGERLWRNRRVGNWLDGGLRTLRKESDLLGDRPEVGPEVVAQIRRLLPAEGWLTKRMARLRERAHRIRKGHVARLDETRHLIRRLPPSKKRDLATELANRYRKLIGFDKRIERLDRSVAENERRIRRLTRGAERAAEKYDFRTLGELLQSAEKLQTHNTKLFSLIDRSLRKLARIARDVGKIAAKENEDQKPSG
jgi:hypothetical protein